MAETLFTELSIIILLTLGVTGIMRLLKQPLVIGYIITGVLAGPYYLNLLQSTENLTTFSHIGVALLLFMVGINLSPNVVRDLGKVALVTGIGQVVFTSLLGFAIAKFLGFSTLVSLYLSIAISFSSTIIIMKLLSDKGDLETLYGRISIGFLIVQDLIAILILLFISSLSSQSRVSFANIILEGAGLLVLLFIAGISFLPWITKAIAKSQEFLLLFSTGWALAVASLFQYFNFSIEIGALLAGVSLSLSPYRYEIAARMKPLRDFFIVLFFILLGSQMVFSDVSQYVLPMVLLSAFVLIGNPVIVMALMGFLGYTRKNGFLAGLTVAQISEFSLILVALGVSVGHLPADILSLITGIGLITIAGSSYMIIYANKIYPWFAPRLKIFERPGKKVDEHRYHKGGDYDIILFGYNRIGFSLLESFRKIKKRFLVVDYNPETILSLAKEKFDCMYGDASDSELLNELNFSSAKMVISSIPDLDTNLLLIRHVHQANQRAIIIVVSHQIDEALTLYDAGATYVLMPHFLGGSYASAMIEKHGLNFQKFIQEKARHMEHLNRRKEIGHEHPTHDRR